MHIEKKKIAFLGQQQGRPVIPLAQAFGIGESHEREEWQSSQWQDLAVSAPVLWEVTDLKDAELVVFPHPYHNDEPARNVARQAAASGLPCLFFRSADDMTPAEPSHGVVYRDSILASRQTRFERAMPALCGDLKAEYCSATDPREWTPRPTVGFCGYVGSALRRAVWSLQGEYERVRGLRLRCRALRALGRCPGVKTVTVCRTRFWGGAIGPKPVTPPERARIRREYLDNVFRTDYTLCVRGTGNFSYRFCEVMSAGRIPVFINTDCALPFADRIDWRRQVVWVEEQDLPLLGEAVVAFHRNLDEDSFRDLQKENRRIWEQWLSPTAFYRHVIDDAARQKTAIPGTQ